MRTFILALVLLFGFIFFNSFTNSGTEAAVNSSSSYYWYEIVCEKDQCWKYTYFGDVIQSIEPIDPY